ncbi:Melanopsin [Desmophyllum pertusum]|uniref:Melanopsin n=1 Tax=Desmophyllum pertusum TaxID=174260 RepID=A0A9X0CJX7_9CNID|nr:Melanopsin [Desmophyllum pertusum]
MFVASPLCRRQERHSWKPKFTLSTRQRQTVHTQKLSEGKSSLDLTSVKSFGSSTSGLGVNEYPTSVKTKMSDFKNKSGKLQNGDAISEQVHYVIAGVYALLGITAIILNTLVIFTFIRDRALCTPSNYLILSIAVGDWLHAVLAYPFGIAANATHGWRMDDVNCSWYAFITTFLSFGIMLHHATFAIERAIVINYSVVVEKKLHVVIVGLWLFALLWSTFPLIGWSAYAPEGASVLCSIHWQSSDPHDIAFIACIFFFLLCGPHRCHGDCILFDLPQRN